MYHYIENNEINKHTINSAAVNLAIAVIGTCIAHVIIASLNCLAPRPQPILVL